MGGEEGWDQWSGRDIRESERGRKEARYGPQGEKQAYIDFAFMQK